jgi:hypothetical protein
VAGWVVGGFGCGGGGGGGWMGGWAGGWVGRLVKAARLVAFDAHAASSSKAASR